jgi:hypothetical protein
LIWMYWTEVRSAQVMGSHTASAQA